MKIGKLQLGNEAIPVEYSLATVMNGNLRETKGQLVLKQNPMKELANALSSCAGANLIEEDGNARWIEFTSYSGINATFVVIPPKAR